MAQIKKENTALNTKDVIGVGLEEAKEQVLEQIWGWRERRVLREEIETILWDNLGPDEDGRLQRVVEALMELWRGK